MITDKGNDYWDPSRTTIMKGKGDLDRWYTDKLYMRAIGSFNFLNIN